jgi:4-hydroxy-2-oxoheptanedioate aldolase
MRTNHVKAALARGETTYGVWCGFPSALVMRLTAQAGYDWLLVDMEHSPIDAQLMTEMVGVIADANGPAPLVRVPQLSVENVKRALDSGAWGVLAPMINTPEEAELLVSISKYPPEGVRSIGGMFAPLGFQVQRAEYLPHANREIMVMLQIESRTGLENVDKILAVPGIDLVFIGPNDLHASLGLTPALESDEKVFAEAVATIKAAADRHNIPLGILASGGPAARKRAEEGFRFIGVTTDASAYLGGLRQQFTAAREKPVDKVAPTGY